MRGRRPKAEDLKDLEGRPGKRPRKPDVPQPTPGMPECPEWLLSEARAEWERVTGDLHRLGLLAEIDRAMLAMYCQLWARYVQTEKRGKLLPAAYMAQIRGLAASFGLEISSRQRLSAPPKEGETDPFEARMKKYQRN